MAERRPSKLRLRALVLAAGEGTRLAPLTSFLPKPLLPVVGRPVVEHTLERLARVGCEAVALNLHHLGGQIRDHLGDEFHGVRLVYSEERERRLGTLGALWPLRDFLSAADALLLVNGDTLCRWPLAPLLRRHLRSQASATLLLTRRPDPADFGGGVAVDRRGRVLGFGVDQPRGEVAARHVFAGAHVLSPELLRRVTEGPADIVRQLYRPLLADGAHLATLTTRRHWHDLGTPRRYLEGVLDFARGPWPLRLWRRSWTAGGAEVAPRVRRRRAVIEAGAMVAAGARLTDTVVLPGARVGAGADVRQSLLGPGAAVPAKARIDRRVVVEARQGVPSGADDSRVDGVLYSPLDAPRRRRNPEPSS